jgi:hypothetical protein
MIRVVLILFVAGKGSLLRAQVPSLHAFQFVPLHPLQECYFKNLDSLPEDLQHAVFSSISVLLSGEFMAHAVGVMNPTARIVALHPKLLAYR